MIRRAIPFLTITLAACAAPQMAEPSLAPRPAELIDPRVPVNSPVQVGTVSPALATMLASRVAAARGGEAEFNARAAKVQRLAPGAGAQASESWVAAQLALSQLVAQQGVATSAAADVDAEAGQRLKSGRWISPADQAAIADAQQTIAAITSRQAAIVEDLRVRLAR